jgi:hypothetical protein
MLIVSMNEQCKHFQSRTYDNGEAARYCSLDLAPEAPWRCPEHCASFSPRLADVGWSHGSLIPKPVDPPPEAEPGSIGALLDAAEDIVADATKALAEERAAVKPPPAWRRFFRRR